MTHKRGNGAGRTLVVDDHAISGRHAVTALGQCHGEVRRAGSATEALRLALSWYPNVICMDLHLPDIDGVALIRKIRKHWPADRPQPRMVVLTGDGEAMRRKDIASLQVDHVLIKPVTGKQLRQVAWHKDTGTTNEPFRDEGWGELQLLFRAELKQRLPELDKSLASLDRNETARILHQLIASAAICRETRLETSLRSLDALCRQSASPVAIGRCYHELLESARGVIFKPSR